MVAAKRVVVWLLVLVGLLSWTGSISGGDLPVEGSQEKVAQTFLKNAQTAKSGTDDVAAKVSALNEIKRIQSQLGGSVLKGSSLLGENADPLSNFDASVRKRLGLPVKPPQENSSSKRPASKVVQTLRDQVTKLDSIANDIEHLREYEHADALRETAKQLRTIARQLDVGADPSKSSSVQASVVDRSVDPTPELRTR